MIGDHMSSQERIHKLEQESVQMKKKIKEIETYIVSGEMSGTVLDSLNYMVQVCKRLDEAINKQQQQLKSITNDMIDMKKFMETKGMYEEYINDRKEKQLALRNAIMMQKMRKEEEELKKKEEELKKRDEEIGHKKENHKATKDNSNQSTSKDTE